MLPPEMRWPLRNQIMGPLLAVALASLTAVGVLHAWLAAGQTRLRIESQLRGVVAVLTTSSFPLTAPVLQKMRDLSSAEFVLTDERGAVLSASLADPPRRFPHAALVDRPLDVSLEKTLDVAGRDYYHTGIVLSAHSGGDGRALHVLFPRDEYRRSWRQAFVPPLVVGVAAIGAGAIAARVLAGRISRATVRLGNEVQRLARGDFSAVPLPATNDEIRDLAQAVNRTATMLANYEQQVRRTEQMRTVARLGASLAHEMRNAATGCRLAIDLHAESCDAVHQDESLAVARRQLQLMETQLQRFMQLGRPPAANLQCEVDLAQLIADLLPLVRPAANHARVEVVTRFDDNMPLVKGDADSLGQIVLNLILNAIEAAAQQPLDRRVNIEVEHAEDDSLALRVRDTGPGPPEVAAQAIFEPFVTTKAEGAGLGLAVVKQIVEAHDGSIAWTRAGGVTQFCVVLPAHSSELSYA
jgi:signal transduction histidine kinase